MRRRLKGLPLKLNDYVAVVLRRWVAVVTLAVLGGLAGWGLAQLTPPTYRATSGIYVMLTGVENASELAQGSTFTRNLMPTYTALATTPEVLNPVIRDLGLQVTPTQLAERITAENPLNTMVINVAVNDRSSSRSAEIADALTSSLATAIERFSPADAESNAALVRVRLLAAGPDPQFPAEPVTRNYIAVGAAAGLVVAVLYALGRDAFGRDRSTVRSSRRAAAVPAS
jgi:capsular polysaccharide biosynthesis protein